MKLITALAASLVVLQAPVRPPQTMANVPGPIGAEPLVVLNVERSWMGADAIWPLINGDNIRSEVRNAAVRALGRTEDPQQVRPLLAFSSRDVAPSRQASAIAQLLYGFDPALDPDLLRLVEEWMRTKADIGATLLERMQATAAVGPAMSHIVYAQPAQAQDVESMLRRLADFSSSNPMPPHPMLYLTAMKGLETLARVNTKIVHYDEKTLDALVHCLNKQSGNADPDARLYAFMALSAARALDGDAEKVALSDDDWMVRRAAMAVLAGTGGGLDGDTRLTRIKDGLSDTSAQVRYEAVRAWGRRAAAANGCQPLVDALKDDDVSVRIEATDLLGDLCKDNDDITTRLEAEATVPPTVGAWQPQTHAFESLAKRSEEKAAVLMAAFTTHQVWWVRMYAAFAAAGAKDVLRLDKLAYDDNDNVREAALNHLRALDPDRAAPATLAALARADVQLVRTAAGMIKEWPADARYVTPLLSSLEHMTRERSMSSRDGRLALLDAIERHARRDDYTDLVPWLRDFDAVVAQRTADVIYHLSQKTMKAEPVSEAHVPTQPFDNLQQCVTIDMANGHPITMKMRPDLAPIAVETFLKLATVDRYYNNLTFHRIVPNFVVQGGSPNANEYSGSREFMRDEIGGSNIRGTVGLSTRGRNTGDAQFFINLVDNPRLDGNYTVFANVLNMDAVDRLQEGDTMRSMTMRACR